MPTNTGGCVEMGGAKRRGHRHGRLHWGTEARLHWGWGSDLATDMGGCIGVSGSPGRLAVDLQFQTALLPQLCARVRPHWRQRPAGHAGPLWRQGGPRWLQPHLPPLVCVWRPVHTAPLCACGSSVCVWRPLHTAPLCACGSSGCVCGSRSALPPCASCLLDWIALVCHVGTYGNHNGTYCKGDCYAQRPAGTTLPPAVKPVVKAVVKTSAPDLKRADGGDEGRSLSGDAEHVVGRREFDAHRRPDRQSKSQARPRAS